VYFQRSYLFRHSIWLVFAIIALTFSEDAK
jgi:hypothetical protein